MNYPALVLSILLCILLQVEGTSQVVDIPDSLFKQFLLDKGVDLNGDGEIQNEEAEAVDTIDIDVDSKFESIEGIKAFTNLEKLSFWSSRIPSIDLSGMTNLKSFSFRGFGPNPKLEEIHLKQLINCESIYLKDTYSLRTVETSELWALKSFSAEGPIEELVLDQMPNVESMRISGLFNSFDPSILLELQYLSLSNFNILELDFSKNENLSELYCQVGALSLDLSNNPLLKRLSVLNCQNLESLYLPESDILEFLDMGSTSLESIELQNYPNLTHLGLSSMPHFSLEFSYLTQLEYLNIGSNDLTQFDLSPFTQLIELGISSNPIKELELAHCPLLETLNITHTDIENISLESVANLKNLYCSYSPIKTLDLSNCSIRRLSVHESPLRELNLKDGLDNTLTLNMSGCDSLEYICANEADIAYIENLFENEEDINPVVNSLCGFDPESDFYNVYAHTKLDLDENGCDDNDTHAQYQKYLIKGEADETCIITGENGRMDILLQPGEFTFKHVLQNEYYELSFDEISFTLQPDSVPNPSFCMIPKGAFDDVEISIFPLDDARPGFSTQYKIVVSNKGTTNVDGSIQMYYQEDFMQLLSSTPLISLQSSSSLWWDFEALAPSARNEYYFTMEMNKPSDNFPLVGGELLGFTSRVKLAQDDLVTLDNIAPVFQLVVNSFDPNDIKCLEGPVIDVDQVGEFVHYMVRFENTGTANAVNVRVQNEIDTTVFDITTLAINDSSHDVMTRIVGNTTDFIFDNIQLPFDDQNNDGYIVYKIKTKAHLKSGDQFTNQAEIYFDFNEAIVTNEYITVVGEIDNDNDGFPVDFDCDDSNSEINPMAVDVPNNGIDENCSGEDLISSNSIDLESNFEIYPNPVSSYDVLYFKTNSAEMIKMNIFNLDGKLLRSSEFYHNEKISMDEFKSGLYLGVFSTSGFSFTKKILVK